MKFELELQLDENKLIKWFPKISDLVGYANDIGFKVVRVKPEGYGGIGFPIPSDDEELHPATTEQIREFLKEYGERENSKI